MVNKVILIGNLGADPELRHTTGGQPVCEMRIATSESWNDKQGERQERTEWHRIVIWGKQGELAARYLAKGRKVYIEGRLQTRDWQDKDGNKRYTTEVVASNVVFLDSRGGGGGGGGYSEPPPPSDNDFASGGSMGGGDGFADDEIPF